MVHVIAEAAGLRLEGDLVLENVRQAEGEILAHLGQRPQIPSRLDLSRVSRLDSAGAVLLRRLEAGRPGQHDAVVLGPLPERLQSFLDYVRLPAEPRPADPTPRVPLLDRLGRRAEADVARTYSFLLLMSDLTWGAVACLIHRTGIRRGSFAEQAFVIGAQGLPITALILFLLGGVSTLQASGQLRQFGATLYVADLLAIGITMELGPLMTA
ncbi:MAG: ABC transporter permease, partial [Gemmatimonadota bacterium]